MDFQAENVRAACRRTVFRESLILLSGNGKVGCYGVLLCILRPGQWDNHGVADFRAGILFLDRRPVWSLVVSWHNPG